MKPWTKTTPPSSVSCSQTPGPRAGRFGRRQIEAELHRGQEGSGASLSSQVASGGLRGGSDFE